MRFLPHQELVAATAVRHESRKIALRSGRKEQRSIESKAFGGNGLQTIDGWIIAKHIIANLRRRHSGTHPGGWPRHGVAAQVDG
jgi:hypothetical protein